MSKWLVFGVIAYLLLGRSKQASEVAAQSDVYGVCSNDNGMWSQMGYLENVP